MTSAAVEAEGLSKRYRLGQNQTPYGRLTESIANVLAAPLRRARAKSSERAGQIWALKDVSLRIEQGEVIGIIGRNGAGKTTLLKVLSRITEPTEGWARLNGRVGSLLEVGTGFHPELTGRENIALNGAILGMSRAETNRKFDDIVSFAEVERFIDTPVKRYSSGMYMRLAFAVAAHLEPDILFVDEVLAVGDTAFQRKCLGRMDSIAHEGRTILFVSHNMAAVQSICKRAYLLDGGRVAQEGPTHDVVDTFLATVSASARQTLSQRQDRQGSGRLRFTDITRGATRTGGTDTVQSGDDLTISLGYSAQDTTPLTNVNVSIGVYTITGQCVSVFNNEIAGAEFASLPARGSIVCEVGRLPLSPGQYVLNVYCEVNGVLADWVQSAATLSIDPGDFFGTGRLPPESHGGVLLPQDWSVVPGDVGLEAEE